MKDFCPRDRLSGVPCPMKPRSAHRSLTLEFSVQMPNLCFFIPLFLISLEVGFGGATQYSRDDFPPNFIFGSGTSAYQVEGAANEDGRTPSTWDTFSRAGYAGGATGDVACDEYHKYMEDVKIMADVGLDAYRFSISWSRLIPNGRGPVNPKGLEYYNNLINELLSHGIQPHVTLLHFDLPQTLEDEYGGWISRKIVKDFTAYADVCFREFGDRVQYWTTVNEPNAYVLTSYNVGIGPPQHCSPPFGQCNCTRGNSTTEPYVAAHHFLLAHASAVKLYRKNYREKQHGFVGLSLYAPCYTPFSDSKEDIIATRRAYDFFLGWFLDPMVSGDYPDVMKKNAGSRIPAFTKAESKMVNGSFDFIGLIHYDNIRVKDNSNILATELRDYLADAAVTLIGWNPTEIEGPITPWALQEVMEYFKQVYENPPIFIYENGRIALRNSTLEDTGRVKYMEAYIGGVLNALRNGSNTLGYFSWSFLDVFEFFGGYTYGYGLYYVDLDDPDLKRYPKLSSRWYSDFLKGKTIDPQGLVEYHRDVSVTHESMSSQ